MNDTGRMAILLHTSRRADDRRRADEWRRLHARPDLVATKPRKGPARQPWVTLRRWVLHHTPG